MYLSEIKTRATAMIEIPVQFLRLRDIAYNFWWSWSPRAHALFEMIDSLRWTHYRNPIELLIDLEPDRWHELQNDADFIKCYRSLVEDFDAYMAPEQPTWFERHYPDHDGSPIAYFSTEFGWHESLQIYSGGLGVLSGDHSKSASDLGLPFIGVGLMYRHGYFKQTIDAEGQQQHFYPDYDLHRLPLLPVVDHEGRELRVPTRVGDREIQLRVWKAAVGRVPVLLLDCDIRENHAADRLITSILYIRGREMRLCQEIVLGMGGVQVLAKLGLSPGVWHMNEGHSALLSVQRIADVIRNRRVSFDEACGEVASSAVFTTHTPVPAGNEVFDANLVRGYFSDWSRSAGFDVEQLLALGHAGNGHDEGGFNLTALAIRTSKQSNGVSEMHGRVANEMWKTLLESEPGRRIEHVTNGVHLPTWIGPEIGELLREHLGRDFAARLLEPGFAAAVQAIPEEQLWEAHGAQKLRLVYLARQRALDQFARHGLAPGDLRQVDDLLHPDLLLIGFARRFTTYKRADLLLRDVERMKAIADNEHRPVQFLFAGKAHPADRPGQDLIRNIWQASLSPGLRGRLLFLENYDMCIGRGLVQGVDVWLNTPRRPLEASGTSGMKAAMNGGLNCSILDGWWCEGYDPAHGWAIGDGEGAPEEEAQDHNDAEALYSVISDEIAPNYYDRDEQGLPREWIRRMKQAMASLSSRFSSARQVRDYTERFYFQN